MIKHCILFLILFISTNIFSQEADTLKVSIDSISLKKTSKKETRLEKREARELKNLRPYNALAPTKAAFYSAVLPGLGQAYTRKYWKIPIVYGALGTGIGISIRNNRIANEFREIYKNRLLGIFTDKYWDQETQMGSSNETIASRVEHYEKQKELSILATVIIYALNIIDANVTAHLQQHNINEKLTLNPHINLDDFVTDSSYGLSLSYNF